MRTTLVINDELFASAKRLASEKQCSLSAIVNDALRRSLKQPSRPAEANAFQIPTFGSGLNATDTLPAELIGLIEDEELALL